MFKATLKSLWGRKLRLLLSTLAIVLGVSFVSGSFVFSDMIRGSMDGALRASYPDVEVTMSETTEVSGGRADRIALDEDIRARAAKVPGVARAEGSISVRGVILIDSKGKALTSFGPPQFGLNWYEAPAWGGRQGAHVVEGRAPRSDDEILVDADTMARSGHHLGDTVKVVTPVAGTVTGRIVGTTRLGSAGAAGASFIHFTTHRAQQLFMDGRPGYTSLWLVTSEGADRGEVARNVQRVLPAGYTSQDGGVTIDHALDETSKNLSFLNTFLLVFAGITLVVACFLVVNTFSILVAQRGRELALFRALGASRGQIFRTVLAEALVLGTIGSLGGLFGGVAIAHAIKKAMLLGGWDIGAAPVALALNTVVTSLATGMVVTLLASLMPARRATRIAPIEAMVGSRVESSTGLGRRAVVGCVMAALGAAAIAVGLADAGPQPALMAGIGMALMLIGVAVASPLLGRPVVWALGALYRKTFGQVGHLASLNSLRQPRRTAATAAALMVGLTLVSAMAVFGRSAQVALTEQVHATVRGDYMVGRQNFEPIPQQVGDRISKVGEVSTVRRAQVGWGERLEPGAKPQGRYDTTIGAMNAADVDHVFPMRITEGKVFAGPNQMVVSEKYAARKGLHVGSSMRVFFGEAQRTLDLEVVGIFSTDGGQAILPQVVSTETLTSIGLGKQDIFLSIELRPGADRSAARTHLDEATADMPLVSVMDLDQYTDSMMAQINQTMALLYALLTLSVVIAVLGIVNTLGLSMVERTREIGLLRAIALDRGMVRRMITLESVVIALLGSVVGVLLGTGFGVVLQRLMAKEITALEIPWGQLAAFVAASVVVGVLAAVVPARSASRTDILRAIASE